MNKITCVEPFLWLLGRWKGRGVGVFPSIPSFSFADQMTFKVLSESFTLEPLIHFEEIAWTIEADGKKFKHWETGFFRPLGESMVELQVTHNTGRIEVLRGKFDFVDYENQCFKAIFHSSFLRNAEGLEEAISSERVLELKNDSLKYKQAMSTTKIPELTNHLDVELQQRREQ